DADKAPDARGLERLWADLGENNAATAQRSLWRLVRAGDGTVGFLKKHLPRDRAATPERLRKLVAELGDDLFGVREAATEELRRSGPAAEEALRQALAKTSSPEVKTRARALLDGLGKWRLPADELRRLRAVAVLGRLGSDEARRVLEELA